DPRVTEAAGHGADLAGCRGDRDRAEREVPGPGSPDRPLHRPAPLGDGAARVPGRSQGVERVRTGEDPDGLAGGVPEPMRAAGGRRGLPGDHLVGREDLLQEAVVAPLVGNAVDGGPGGPRRGRAVEHGHADLLAGLELALDGRRRQPGVGAGLHDVEDAGHQKTRKRRAPRTSSAIRSRVTGTTGWPSAFQSGSDGIAAASTWKGTPSVLRVARNLAMSSPSTSSSVSASSRWTAPSVSTRVTWFSPATTPTPIRMASNARWERRGSAEMSTRTGSGPATSAPRGTLVQGDEAVGAVDDVRQHHQAAVREVGRVLQGDAALLAAVGAHEEPGAAAGQRPDARVVQGPDAVVDEVEVEVGAPVERRPGQAQGRLEVRAVIGAGGEQQAQLLPGQVHRPRSLTS